MAGGAAAAHRRRGAASINDAGQGKKKKSPAIVGVAVACVAGVLFGACFNPAQHAIDSVPRRCTSLLLQ
jgi:hypothetical protein